jgi:hypothetical protein
VEGVAHVKGDLGEVVGEAERVDQGVAAREAGLEGVAGDRRGLGSDTTEEEEVVRDVPLDT